MDTYSVAIYLWDGVEELDFAGPYEVLKAWSSGTDRPITVRTVSDAGGVVRCANGLRVVPDVSWANLGEIDLFVLPGGDSRLLTTDEKFLRRMRDLADSGTLMTSVCTGALVYAKAGLLDGRPATTQWGAVERLGEYGRDIRVDGDSRFVDDGNVVTAAGVSAGIDMALHLIARLDSVEAAQRIRRYIQYDPQPPI